MSEARIGRVVVASLHEALAHQLPLRLEFYETYLRPMGMRAGTIGIASFAAALSFLRREHGAYDPVTREAGRLAAEWSFEELPALRRLFWARMPSGLRQRAGLRLTARLVDTTVRGARGKVVGKRRAPRLAITGSPFCDVRHRGERPLCGFYAAALERFCELLDVPSDVAIDACHAGGASQCEFDVRPGDASPAATASNSSSVGLSNTR